VRADLVVLLASDANKAVETLRSEKELDDVPAKFLAGAARHLRVVSYAAAVTARRFEKLAEQRDHAESVRRAQILAEEAMR
jgi:hypothetical protein